jgi:hypothetical protein
VGVIVWREDEHGTMVKGNNDDGWSSVDVVLWLGRRQNGDTVEWCEEWPRLRCPFSSSGGWESGDPGRVANGGGADSMLQFRLERGGDWIKHCQKMKWRRQRAHPGSMGKKHDMARWSGDVGQRRGGTREGKGGDDTN